MNPLRRVLSISFVLLSAASAGAEVRESIRFASLFSSGAPGATDNSSRTITLQGGYTLDHIDWAGILSPLTQRTRGDHALVRITRPDGSVRTIALGSGGPFSDRDPFFGSSTLPAGVDPAGSWTFEFYELQDDTPGFDARWDRLQLNFHDNTPEEADTGDLDICRLYSLQFFGRVGDEIALMASTTAHNVGTAKLDWFASPDPRHPFINQNLFRLDGDRITQIGQSWSKHGFGSANAIECGGDSCGESSGAQVGLNCTDSYNAATNANQPRLGPRAEINPWTGAWTYRDSVLHSGEPTPTNPLQRRLRVRDADLRATSLEGGPRYFLEGYYVAADDTNVWNNAAWKPVTVSGDPPQGVEWRLDVSDEGIAPNSGFAIDAWPGAMQTLIAESFPVVEFESPDGRAIIAAKARQVAEHLWHYEYAIYNVDMDRQVGGWSIPLPPGADVQDVGFHAPTHDDGALGPEPYDNDAWSVTLSGESITWSTASNPVRWGTLYNFWFDANVPPGEVLGSATPHSTPSDRQDAPTELEALTIGPVTPSLPCPGDANGDGTVTFADLNEILDAWNTDVAPGVGPDVAPDGIINAQDLQVTLEYWAAECRSG